MLFKSPFSSESLLSQPLKWIFCSYNNKLIWLSAVILPPISWASYSEGSDSFCDSHHWWCSLNLGRVTFCLLCKLGSTLKKCCFLLTQSQKYLHVLVIKKQKSCKSLWDQSVILLKWMNCCWTNSSTKHISPTCLPQHRHSSLIHDFWLKWWWALCLSIHRSLCVIPHIHAITQMSTRTKLRNM